VGGFSQPNRKQVKSLQELLGIIRPLGLEFVQGHALQEQNFLGEGVSYEVFKCIQRQSGTVVAVKQIKLPPSSSQEASDRQVACVLRDIQVCDSVVHVRKQKSDGSVSRSCPMGHWRATKMS
jgi:hypothetical protein